jgi:hypothetical protein
MKLNWTEQRQLLDLAQEALCFLSNFRKYAPPDLHDKEPWATLLLRYEELEFLVSAVREGKPVWDRLAEETYMWCEKLAWKFPLAHKVVIHDRPRPRKRVYC